LKELLNEKEPELEDLENSQAIHVVKNEKACCGQNTKDVTGQSLRKKIIHGSKQPSQQKPVVVEMGLYRQRHCQFGRKSTEMG